MAAIASCTAAAVVAAQEVAALCKAVAVRRVRNMVEVPARLKNTLAWDIVAAAAYEFLNDALLTYNTLKF